ncbi:MAG: coproporphyrinogen dehydrogenase HemZ [Clostridia bacterium]|nr:coproporphyrinogen dehydrogenase HemZ [Clostridia bacterium]
MKLETNIPEYYNDICEEIRLFVPDAEVAIGDRASDDGMTLSVDLAADGRFASRVSFTRNGEVFSYSYETPHKGEDGIELKRYAKRNIKVAIFRCLRKTYPDRLIPWGSLTGIRPTRLLSELEKSMGVSEAERVMREEFDVSPEKIALAKEITDVQRPVFASAKPDDIGVYIGVPFCRTRCLYCSFASEVRTKKTDMSAYLDALAKDIVLGSAMTKELGLEPRSFYFGGGTPTVLTAEELDRILDVLTSAYPVAGKEFTVEAGRPDTITREKLLVLKAYGVTRISVNPQTMCDRTLRLVGRDHTAEDIKRCFCEARGIGFGSINMDLIAGLPNEDERDMEHSLEEIKKLDPDCLTVHTLAIKRASRLKEHMSDYVLPSVETVERMVRLGRECAKSMGMKPYYMYRQKYMAGNLENVGYSKEGHICVYNIDMMEDRMSIIAHGAGAMTKRVWPDGGRIERVPNPKDIATYIEKLPAVNAERKEMFKA